MHFLLQMYNIIIILQFKKQVSAATSVWKFESDMLDDEIYWHAANRLHEDIN